MQERFKSRISKRKLYKSPSKGTHENQQQRGTGNRNHSQSRNKSVRAVEQRTDHANALPTVPTAITVANSGISPVCADKANEAATPPASE
ncbi:hypothetical protein HPB50_005588 [Hyalomma asiaticum]|uniref:Uncharacterized protein n=1 Tax=Hyalomma asiaticum TaxID=266040 RepID=A0ACB7S0V1_HYAAI|nr:hypothetical protein HPB50_005588 [Hyalomma asiaticum]